MHDVKRGKSKTRMWANAQRDGRPAEYRWRRVLNAAKFGSRPLLRGRKVNIARGKVLLLNNSRRKCINSLPAQETAKHHAKFGWLLLSDVAAVTKPRRESH